MKIFKYNKKIALFLLTMTFGVALFSLAGQDVYASSVEDLFKQNTIQPIVSGDESLGKITVVDSLDSISFSSITNNPNYVYVKSDNQAYKLLYYTTVTTIGDKLENQTYPVYAPITSTLEGKWQISDKGITYSYYDILKYMPHWEENGTTYYKSNENTIYALRNGATTSNENEAYYKYLLSDDTNLYYAYQEVYDANLVFKYQNGDLITFDNISPSEYNELTQTVLNINAKEYEYELMIEAPQITYFYEPTKSKIGSEEWNNHPEYVSSYYYNGNIYVYITNDEANGNCYYRYSLSDLKTLNYVTEDEAKTLLDSSNMSENKTILIEENNELIVKIKDNYDLIEKTYQIYNCIKSEPEKVYYEETSYIYNNSTETYDELTATYYATSFDEKSDIPTHFDTTFEYWFSYQSMTQYDLYKVLYEKVLYNYHHETSNFIETNVETCTVTKTNEEVSYVAKNGAILLTNLNNETVENILASLSNTYYSIDSASNDNFQTLSNDITTKINYTEFTSGNSMYAYPKNNTSNISSYSSADGSVGYYNYYNSNGKQYVVSINGDTSYSKNLVTDVYSQKTIKFNSSSKTTIGTVANSKTSSQTFYSSEFNSQDKVSKIFTDYSTIGNIISNSKYTTQELVNYFNRDIDANQSLTFYCDGKNWTCKNRNGNTISMGNVIIYERNTSNFYQGQATGLQPFKKITNTSTILNGKTLITVDSLPTYTVTANYRRYRYVSVYKYTNYSGGSSGYIFNTNNSSYRGSKFEGSHENKNTYGFCLGHSYKDGCDSGTNYCYYDGYYFSNNTKLLTYDPSNTYIENYEGSNIANDNSYIVNWYQAGEWQHNYVDHENCTPPTTCEYISSVKYVYDNSAGVSGTKTYSILSYPSISDFTSDNVYSSSFSFTNFTLNDNQVKKTSSLYENTTTTITANVSSTNYYALIDSKYFPSSPDGDNYAVNNSNKWEEFKNGNDGGADSIKLSANNNISSSSLITHLVSLGQKTITNYCYTTTCAVSMDMVNRIYLTKERFTSALNLNNNIFDGSLEDYKTKLINALKEVNPYDDFDINFENQNQNDKVDYYRVKLIINDNINIYLPNLYTQKTISYYSLIKTVSKTNKTTDYSITQFFNNMDSISLNSNYGNISESNPISKVVKENTATNVSYSDKISNVTNGSNVVKTTISTTTNGRFVFDNITTDSNSQRYLIVNVLEGESFNENNIHNGNIYNGYNKYNGTIVSNSTSINPELTADIALQNKTSYYDYYQATDNASNRYIYKNFEYLGTQSKERETISKTLSFTKIAQNPNNLSDYDSSDSLYSYTNISDVKNQINSMLDSNILNSDLKLEKIDLISSTGFYSALKYITSYQYNVINNIIPYGTQNDAYIGQANASKYGTYTNIAFDNNLFITNGDYAETSSSITTKSRNEFNQNAWFKNLNSAQVLKYIENDYFVIKNITDSELVLYSNDDSNKVFGYTTKTGSIETRKITIAPNETIYIKDIYLNNALNTLHKYTKYVEFNFGDFNKRTYACQTGLEIETTFVPYERFKDESYASKFSQLDSKLYTIISGYLNDSNIASGNLSYDERLNTLKEILYIYENSKINVNNLLYSLYGSNGYAYFVNQIDKYVDEYTNSNQQELEGIENSKYYYRVVNYKEGINYVASTTNLFLDFDSYSKNYATEEEFNAKSCNIADFEPSKANTLLKTKNLLEEYGYTYGFNKELQCFFVYDNVPYKKYNLYIDSTKDDNGNKKIEGYTKKYTIDELKELVTLDEETITQFKNVEMPLLTTEESINLAVQENKGKVELTFENNNPKNIVFLDGTIYSNNTKAYLLNNTSKLLNTPLFTNFNSDYKLVLNSQAQKFYIYDEYEMELSKQYMSFTKDYVFIEEETNPVDSSYKTKTYYFVYDSKYRELLKSYQDSNTEYDVQKLLGDENGKFNNKYDYVILYVNEYGDLYANKNTNLYYDTNLKIWTSKDSNSTNLIKFNYTDNSNFNNIELASGFEVEKTVDVYELNKYQTKINIYVDDYDNTELLDINAYSDSTTNISKSFFRIRLGSKSISNFYDRIVLDLSSGFYPEGININILEKMRWFEPTFYLQSSLALNDNSLGIKFNDNTSSNMVEFNNYIYKKGTIYQLQTMYKNNHKYDYNNSVSNIKSKVLNLFDTLNTDDIDETTLYTLFYGTPTIQRYVDSGDNAWTNWWKTLFGSSDSKIYTEPLGTLNGVIVGTASNYTYSDVNLYNVDQSNVTKEKAMQSTLDMQKKLLLEGTKTIASYLKGHIPQSNSNNNDYFDYLFNYCTKKTSNDKYDAIKLLLLINVCTLNSNNSYTTKSDYIILNVGDEKWVYQAVNTDGNNSEFEISWQLGENEVELLNANIGNDTEDTSLIKKIAKYNLYNSEPQKEYNGFTINQIQNDSYAYRYDGINNFNSNTMYFGYYNERALSLYDAFKSSKFDYLFEHYGGASHHFKDNRIVAYEKLKTNMGYILIFYSLNINEWYQAPELSPKYMVLAGQGNAGSNSFDPHGNPWYEIENDGSYHLANDSPSFPYWVDLSGDNGLVEIGRQYMLWNMNENENNNFSFANQSTFFTVYIDTLTDGKRFQLNGNWMPLFRDGEQIIIKDFLNPSSEALPFMARRISFNGNNTYYALYNELPVNTEETNYGDYFSIAQRDESRQYWTTGDNKEILKNELNPKIVTNYSLKTNIDSNGYILEIKEVCENKIYNFELYNSFYDLISSISNIPSNQFLLARLLVEHEIGLYFADSYFGLDACKTTYNLSEILQFNTTYKEFAEHLDKLDYTVPNKVENTFVNEDEFFVQENHDFKKYGNYIFFQDTTSYGRFNNNFINLKNINNPFYNQNVFAKTTNFVISKFYNDTWLNSKTPFENNSDKCSLNFVGTIYTTIDNVPLEKYITFNYDGTISFDSDHYILYDVNGYPMDIQRIENNDGYKDAYYISYGNLYSITFLNYLSNQELIAPRKLAIVNQYYSLSDNFNKTLLDPVLNSMTANGLLIKNGYSNISIKYPTVITEEEYDKYIEYINQGYTLSQEEFLAMRKEEILNQTLNQYKADLNKFYIFDNLENGSFDLYYRRGLDITNLGAYRLFADKYQLIQEIKSPDSSLHNLLYYDIENVYDNDNITSQNLKIHFNEECIIRLSYEISWKGTLNGKDVTIYTDSKEDREFIERKAYLDNPNSKVVHYPELNKSVVYIILNDVTKEEAPLVSNQFFNFELRNNNKLNYYSLNLKKGYEINVPLSSQSKYTLEVYNVFGTKLTTESFTTVTQMVKNPYGTSLKDNGPTDLKYEYISKALRQLIYSNGEYKYGSENNGIVYSLPQEYILQVEKTLGTATDIAVLFKTNDRKYISGKMIIENFYGNNKNLEVEIKNGIALINIEKLRTNNWNFDGKFAKYQTDGHYEITQEILQKFFANEILSRYTISFKGNNLVSTDVNVFVDMAYSSDYCYLDLNQDGKCDSLNKWTLSNGQEIIADSKYYNILGQEIITETKYAPNSYLGLYNVPKYMSKIEDNILEVSSVISNAVELLYKANGSSEFNSSTIALRIIKKDNNTAKLYYYSTNGTPVIIG